VLSPANVLGFMTHSMDDEINLIGVRQERVEMVEMKLFRQTEPALQHVHEVRASDGGAPIDKIVDFLVPRHAEIVKAEADLFPDFVAFRFMG